MYELQKSKQSEDPEYRREFEEVMEAPVYVEIQADGLYTNNELFADDEQDTNPAASIPVTNRSAKRFKSFFIYKSPMS